MRSTSKLLGHPLHPALVHFPIAFWTATTLLDVGTLFHFYDGVTLAWYCLLVATVTALPALATGMIELAKLDELAVKLGDSHMLLMCSAWVTYLVGALTRAHEMHHQPTLISCVCSVIGLVLMSAGGWLGGKLVYEHGAGSALSK